MINAVKFKEVFGVYATEIWAMPESDFLQWLNGECNGEERKTGKWKKVLITTVPFTIYGYECPFCEFRAATNSFNFCPNCGEKVEADGRV